MTTKLTPRQEAEAIEQFGDDLAALMNAFDRQCRYMSNEAVERINAIPNQDHMDTVAEAFRKLGDDLCREPDPETRTVDQAERLVGELTGDAAKVAALIAACLNAEAALHMLGCKLPKRRKGFLPVGVLTLVEIERVLASMPDETALVKASMAFGCDYCGRPAEAGTDDGWICDACYSEAVSDEA